MHLLLLVIHVLLSGVWLGAMVYSLAVLHPRARRYFADDAAGFEALVATLAQGARWKVLGMASAIALTGVALFVLSGGRVDRLIVVKSVAFVAAIGVFGHASWVLWPRRIFATPAEAPLHQRRFRVVAVMMIALVGVATVAGIIRGHVG